MVSKFKTIWYTSNWHKQDIRIWLYLGSRHVGKIDIDTTIQSLEPDYLKVQDTLA
jgi:hypothetical protein